MAFIKMTLQFYRAVLQLLLVIAKAVILDTNRNQATATAISDGEKFLSEWGIGDR